MNFVEGYDFCKMEFERNGEIVTVAKSEIVVMPKAYWFKICDYFVDVESKVELLPKE